jgi:hypothetical protein
VLERKLSGRRKHSKLPALVDFVLARPLVSAGMIAAELGVTARAAQDLVAELGIREDGTRALPRVGRALKGFVKLLNVAARSCA